MKLLWQGLRLSVPSCALWELQPCNVQTLSCLRVEAVEAGGDDAAKQTSRTSLAAWAAPPNRKTGSGNPVIQSVVPGLAASAPLMKLPSFWIWSYSAPRAPGDSEPTEAWLCKILSNWTFQPKKHKWWRGRCEVHLHLRTYVKWFVKTASGRRGWGPAQPSGVSPQIRSCLTRWLQRLAQCSADQSSACLFLSTYLDSLVACVSLMARGSKLFLEMVAHK